MRRAPPILLTGLWLLGACDDSSTSSQPNAERPADTPLAEDERPTAYAFDADEDDAQQVDLAAVEVAIQALLDDIHQFNASPVLDSYDHFMRGADSQCPAYYEQNGNAFWYSNCMAESGAVYEGYAFYTLYDQAPLFGDGLMWDGVVLNGTADMVSTEGDRFHLGGQAFAVSATGNDGNSDYILYRTGISGAFFADDPGVADSWIASGQAPTMTIYAATYPDYNINYMLVEGDAAVSGSASGAVTAISFNNLLMYTYLPNFYPCREEPSGSIQFRDDQGNWYDVTFDVDAERQVMAGGECDGCGMVTRNEEVIGQVCIDASTLVSWEETPW